MKITSKTFLFSLAALVGLAGCRDLITAMHGGDSAAAQRSGMPQTAAPGQQQRLSIDTTLGELTHNADARAIVDRFLPGVLEGPHAAMAANYTPRQLQARMPSLLTQAQLAQMNSELAAIR